MPTPRKISRGRVAKLRKYSGRFSKIQMWRVGVFVRVAENVNEAWMGWCRGNYLYGFCAGVVATMEFRHSREKDHRDRAFHSLYKPVRFTCLALRNLPWRKTYISPACFNVRIEVVGVVPNYASCFPVVSSFSTCSSLLHTVLSTCRIELFLCYLCWY